jgi:hypothetical protein
MAQIGQSRWTMAYLTFATRSTPWLRSTDSPRVSQTSLLCDRPLAVSKLPNASSYFANRYTMQAMEPFLFVH